MIPFFLFNNKKLVGEELGFIVRVNSPADSNVKMIKSTFELPKSGFRRFYGGEHWRGCGCLTIRSGVLLKRAK